MELRDIKTHKDNSVTLDLVVDRKDFMDGDDTIGKVAACNEITFDTIDKAKDYFDKVYKQNKNIIENNKERLQQIDGDILKLNDFVSVIEKSNALSKRNSEKIENFIDSYHQVKSLERNVEKTEQQNNVNKEILDKLNNL